MAQTRVAELTGWPADDQLGICTLQAFPCKVQLVIIRHRVTGRIARSYSGFQPIDAEVLRIARRVEHPLSEDCRCVFAGPDVHCSYEAGDLSQQEIVALRARCARTVILEFQEL